MEAILATASNEQIPLLGEISLGLSPTAPYVIGRNLSTTYCPSPEASFGSSNTFTVSVASASQWMDPLTHEITFNVVNLGNQPLQFASSNPMTLFQRYELRLGGIILEDIFNSDRLANLLNIYESTDKRITTSNLGFGTQDNMESAGDDSVNPQLYESRKHSTVRIPAGGSKRVCMAVNISGLLNQFRWIPLWAVNGPLELRFTLQDPKQCTVLRTAAGADTQSQNYKLTEIALHCSLCTLDSELQAKYFASVASGESLLMHITNWSHNQLFLSPSGTGDFNAVLNRPLSRLDTVCTSLAPEITQEELAKGINYATLFWASDNVTNNNQEKFEIQYQLGPSRYPDAPIVGYSQVYYRDLEALGIKNSGSHSLGVDYDSFKSVHFASLLDVSKVPGVRASGQNMAGGQEFRVAVRNFAGDVGSATRTCNRLYVAMLYDCFIEIRGGSITKLD